jgi:dTDP-4-dehydrorhamnose 3,5-epimerase
MIVKETKIRGCFLIQPKVFNDKRGYFIESFNQKTFNKMTGLTTNFIQDNESMSSKGVLRGLHFQVGEHSQAKLLRVIKGKVLDVVVDLRPSSETFKKTFSIELSEENKTQLFIPRGFAHGFIVLEDETIFSYKCDNYYNRESEAGIIYNDPQLNIDWRLNKNEFILSLKDTQLPLLENTLL